FWRQKRWQRQRPTRDHRRDPVAQRQIRRRPPPSRQIPYHKHDRLAFQHSFTRRRRHTHHNPMQPTQLRHRLHQHFRQFTRRFSHSHRRIIQRFQRPHRQRRQRFWRRRLGRIASNQRRVGHCSCHLGQKRG